MNYSTFRKKATAIISSKNSFFIYSPLISWSIIIKHTEIVLSALIFIFLTLGCAPLVKTQKSLPQVYFDHNKTHDLKRDIPISLMAFKNYTDTSQAGQRAANIVEGVLISKGYKVISHLETEVKDINTALKISKEDNAKYLMYGAVSEWRYKTGIDGEPAISLKCMLIDTASSDIIWSSTASDNDWGNASLGTTAQRLIMRMFSEDE